MRENTIYRAHIVEYPEFEQYEAFDERGEGGAWTCPVGWTADADYIERFGTNKYFEPDTSKFYKSRSSAKARVDLLNSMGYRAIVQRSAPVEWPADGKEKIQPGEALEVAKAVGVLKRAGVIQSADELF
ncbi:hypothetical protein [Corynebacterium rhinophilum]|uniref:hypothetical protein n=1 Tax=Corynebacterium rhinophilum TaxID=3050197 RepID=UPI00254B389F|nr:hypothetical protein [Corynebacterium sp. MSK192]MDK8698428.1 hypothetical protein [Corynebacterium sp. MSK192]